jgi:hypothetical protein
MFAGVKRAGTPEALEHRKLNRVVSLLDENRLGASSGCWQRGKAIVASRCCPG